jgi:hypothetical protein
MSDDKPGPTGDFPRGKIAEDDEGELNCMVSHSQGVVRVDFGTTLSWFALEPKMAVAFASAILAHAKQSLGE